MSTNPPAGPSGQPNDPWSTDPTAPGQTWSSPQPLPDSGDAPAGGDALAPQQPGYGGTSAYGYSTPQGAGQPGYGSSSYGSVPPYPPYTATFGRDHPQGTLVLILGIVSIVLCQATGPFAWVMGRKALAEIDANPSAYANRGMVQAGMICGIVGTVLLVFVVVMLIVYFGLVAAVFSAAATST